MIDKNDMLDAIRMKDSETLEENEIKFLIQNKAYENIPFSGLALIAIALKECFDDSIDGSGSYYRMEYDYIKHFSNDVEEWEFDFTDVDEFFNVFRGKFVTEYVGLLESGRDVKRHEYIYGRDNVVEKYTFPMLDLKVGYFADCMKFKKPVSTLDNLLKQEIAKVLRLTPTKWLYTIEDDLKMSIGTELVNHYTNYENEKFSYINNWR